MRDLNVKGSRDITKSVKKRNFLLQKFSLQNVEVFVKQLE